jgi:hypothetical protein
LLFGASVLWWAVAQTVATYYDSIHASVQEPWPSDIIYFLGMSVPLMILFIDQKNGFERKQWPRLFDLAQVFIIMLAVYLFTFDTPDAWRNGWGTLGQIAWIPETSRDVLPLSSFSLCAAFGKHRPARDLYGRKRFSSWSISRASFRTCTCKRHAACEPARRGILPGACLF